MSPVNSNEISMRQIITFLLLIASIFNISAIERYVSRPVSDGTLYFIMPKKLGEVSGAKSFLYDVTMVSGLDSATINFTVVSPLASEPSELIIRSGSQLLECDDSKLLFVDKTGKNFEIRVTSHFPKDKIEEIFSSPNIPQFEFMIGDTPVSATYKPGAWKKDRLKMIEVFNLLKLMK